MQYSRFEYLQGGSWVPPGVPARRGRLELHTISDAASIALQPRCWALLYPVCMPRVHSVYFLRQSETKTLYSHA